MVMFDESAILPLWGQVPTGGGYSPLQESMPTLGVPVMMKTFIQTKVQLGNDGEKCYVESMKVGEEERQLAV